MSNSKISTGMLNFAALERVLVLHAKLANQLKLREEWEVLLMYLVEFQTIINIETSNFERCMAMKDERKLAMAAYKEQMIKLYDQNPDEPDEERDRQADILDSLRNRAYEQFEEASDLAVFAESSAMDAMAGLEETKLKISLVSRQFHQALLN